ncbi:valine--tRNA ligase [Patescibacteria group bacterium]|nr:valine--tRNA ligase [Patescibacteria group bacterium]
MPDQNTAQPDFPKSYTAAEHEAAIYALWEKAGAFSPGADTGKPSFSIIMPPPNANGNLHMGHSLFITLQDILTRYHRMKGDRTLWVPGADHAGIETQVVFEKKLEKEGRSRFQMTREQFYQEAWEFTQENKQNMEAQLRMHGASCDWSIERFTLDPKVVEAVYATFRKMYADGLIYRGERIVNYSVKYRTAYSDLEVEHVERQDPLYYIKYGPITVATVRPETKFGEKVIVVHPDDERYRQWIGKTVRAKIVTGEELEMTVIADEAIKPEFGTGAMTITPAHDPIDFEIARRHNLPIIPIIGLDGKMLPIAGEFAGMKVEAARAAIAGRMQELGLIEKIDPTYTHIVGLCYKSKQPIEPMLMPQWFVKVAPLAERAIAAIEADEIEFYPKSYKKIQLDWLRNLKDWNISRQIWWGIPIAPAMPDNPEVANDPDTFDTWFSSGQWPAVALQAAGDRYLQDFYPTSVMETGHDLIFLWVTRMILLGLYTQNKVPFKKVYLHGLVLDPLGKKMSKSKGNVVSPVDLIAKYGADAVRFGLLISSAAGSNFSLPEEKMVGGRNFANKLWNITRFILMQLDGRLPSQLPVPTAVTDADKTVLEQIKKTRKGVDAHLEQFRFAQALQAIHDFTWHQFADIYLEAAKNQKDDTGRTDDQTAAILFSTLRAILTTLHPFMPFVTEALYQRLPERDGLLITQSWHE